MTTTTETRTQFRVFLAHHDRLGRPLPPERVLAWRDAVLAAFPGGGATSHEAVGRWAGRAEPTTVVEALVLVEYEGETDERLRHVLVGYREACAQTATLYTKTPGVVCVWG
jgi:hypothetical protein